MGDAGGAEKDGWPGRALFLWAGETYWGKQSWIQPWHTQMGREYGCGTDVFGSTRGFGNKGGGNSQSVLGHKGLLQSSLGEH